MIRFQPCMTGQIVSQRNVELIMDVLQFNVPLFRQKLLIHPVTLSTPTNEIDNVYAIDYVMRDYLPSSKSHYIEIKYFTPLERPSNPNLMTHIWVDNVTKLYPQVFVLMDRRQPVRKYDLGDLFCATGMEEKVTK